jgi:four helix bundle protein
VSRQRQKGKSKKAKGKSKKAEGETRVDKPRDLVERSFQFALAIVRVCRVCELRSGTARTLGRHLLRSATSIGANIEEAQAGQSRADFICKYAIALKEARETRYWPRLLSESGESPDESTAALMREAEELKRIIATIIVKAKQNSSPQ